MEKENTAIIPKPGERYMPIQDAIGPSPKFEVLAKKGKIYTANEEGLVVESTTFTRIGSRFFKKVENKSG